MEFNSKVFSPSASAALGFSCLFRLSCELLCIYIHFWIHLLVVWASICMCRNNVFAFFSIFVHIYFRIDVSLLFGTLQTDATEGEDKSCLVSVYVFFTRNY